MPAYYTVDEIIEITGGRLAQGMVPDEAGPLAVDTRLDLTGAWFVAIGGENFDGHDFIGDAFCAGALGCIVEDRGSYPIASTSFPLIAVDDTEEALGKLVGNWRKRMRKQIALVTSGSLSEPSSKAKQLLAAIEASTGESPSGGQPAPTLPHIISAGDFSADGSRELDSLEEPMALSLLVDWRLNVSEILCRFLNLPDETEYLVADFAPRPLARAAWLLSVLRPDVLIVTQEGYEYDRLSGAHDSPCDIKLAMAGVIAQPGDRRRGICLTDSKELAEKLSVAQIDSVSASVVLEHLGLKR